MKLQEIFEYNALYQIIKTTTIHIKTEQIKLHSKTYARRQNMGYLNNAQAHKKCNITKLSK